MSWKEINKVEQRHSFVIRYLSGERIIDLCQEYGISRKTGYKFIKRFKEFGICGMKDFSKRPHLSPMKTNPFIENLIVKYKEKHLSWGPKKIKIKLEQMNPGLNFPSANTFGIILNRHGLVKHRKKRIKRSYHHSHLTEGENPNDVWCVDYKGQFRTLDKKYCYPLTISDHASRFLIACEGLENTSQNNASPVFRRCFKEYGIPKIIRSDNGIPFAAPLGLFGLSKLSVWFLKLGIKLERIEPGKPQQNGRHERIHRTLKQETLRPPANNIFQQQEKFDYFLKEYNFERPHEALNQKTPNSIYTKSRKQYSEKIEEPLEYPTHDFRKRVCSNGIIKIDPKRYTLIGSAFAGEFVGLRELSSKWLVSFANYDLGYICKKTLKFESMEVIED